jgi:hypothetical protein
MAATCGRYDIREWQQHVVGTTYENDSNIWYDIREGKEHVVRHTRMEGTCRTTCENDSNTLYVCNVHTTFSQNKERECILQREDKERECILSSYTVPDIPLHSVLYPATQHVPVAAMERNASKFSIHKNEMYMVYVWKVHKTVSQTTERERLLAAT